AYFLADIDLLDPPPLAFPHREALYKDVWGMGSETWQKDGCEGKFISALDSESSDKAIEAGDRIYDATLHPRLMMAETWASQTTSQHLAQAFVANFQPKPLCSTVPHHLQDFEDVSKQKDLYDALVTVLKLLDCSAADNLSNGDLNSKPKLKKVKVTLTLANYKPSSDVVLALFGQVNAALNAMQLVENDPITPHSDLKKHCETYKLISAHHDHLDKALRLLAVDQAGLVQQLSVFIRTSG
ncbi:hypothetical protein C0995_003341, partial [Termitomyces sp. Mi166